MIPSDLTEWQAQKRQLTRDAFGQKFAHPFLVRRAHRKEGDSGEGGDFGGEKLSFHTNVAEGAAIGDVTTGSIRLSGATVFPVVKKPQNPYPDRISVGRALNCDVVIRDGTVSKLHGHFTPLGPGALELTDRASQNGTKVNGQLLKADLPKRLASGDTIIFGSIAVQYLDAKKLWDLL